MTLTNPITLRLSPEKLFLFEAEAAYKGKTLGAYLRERLEKEESPSQTINPLNQFPHLSNASSLSQNGLLVEVLLLLRLLSSPEKLLWVQRELKRLNLPLWGEEILTKKSD